MTVPHAYHFRRATPSDLPLLAAWLSAPHVRAWWDRGKPYDEADLADPRVRRWTVSFGGRPFAFMQDYDVAGFEGHHFAALPKGARGIDQFIGIPSMLGAGHGTAFIGQRLSELFAEGAPLIATDPHPLNGRAIVVYMKLGFNVAGPPKETDWGLILPMTADRPPDDTASKGGPT